MTNTTPAREALERAIEGGTEDGHIEWDRALLARLRELGDIEFADRAEEIRDKVIRGFWYA